MARAAGKGGGLQFSGKYVAKTGGDGSSTPPDKSPQGSKSTPGWKAGVKGPSNKGSK